MRGRKRIRTELSESRDTLVAQLKPRKQLLRFYPEFRCHTEAGMAEPEDQGALSSCGLLRFWNAGARSQYQNSWLSLMAFDIVAPKPVETTPDSGSAGGGYMQSPRSSK